MGKRARTKRVPSATDAAAKSIDLKARKRIEELYELTDEIINAYNEVNETYVNKIYRKYKQLQNENKKLKLQLHRHHCPGCKCTTSSTIDVQVEENNEENDDLDADSSTLDEGNQNDRPKTRRTTSLATPNTRRTRAQKNNPFLIPNVEDTQNFDDNDSRLNGNNNADDVNHEDAMSMNTSQHDTTQDESQSEIDDDAVDKIVEEHGEEIDEGENMARLPLALREIIQRKAKKSKGAKDYLLEIPSYPALCEYLRDGSVTSFDRRPSENQVRPLIENHIGKQSATVAKIRMRLRDELREIHRSYLRTFSRDPHSVGARTSFHKTKRLTIKTSPV